MTKQKYEKIDYLTLAKRVGDMVLNNCVRQQSENFDDWTVENGATEYCYKHDTKAQCKKNDHECDYEYHDIYQDYIITSSGADYLTRKTDEIVFYNEKLDMYVWGITHYGTAWDYVFTQIKTN